MFAIEKNVPVARSTQGAPIYPFREMKPGDSFFVPEGGGNFMSVRRAASAWGQRNQIKMTARKVDGGLRVWRIA